MAGQPVGRYRLAVPWVLCAERLTLVSGIEDLESSSAFCVRSACSTTTRPEQPPKSPNPHKLSPHFQCLGVEANQEPGAPIEALFSAPRPFSPPSRGRKVANTHANHGSGRRCRHLCPGGAADAGQPSRPPQPSTSRRREGKSYTWW